MQTRAAIDGILGGLAREMFDAATASLFDPAPITFTRAHDKGAAPVRRVLTREAGRIWSLRTPLTRNAFLWGCYAATDDEDVEHLIVGLGRRHGSTTLVDSIRHQIGEAHRVSVPADLRADVDVHVATGARHEVIIFHNHPSNPLHPIIDNEPLASTADRGLLLHMRYLQPLVALKTLLGQGNLRFFVGENGFVKEFRTPVLSQLFALMARPC